MGSQPEKVEGSHKKESEALPEKPPINFKIVKKKYLNEITPDDIPPGLSAEDVAIDG